MARFDRRSCAKRRVLAVLCLASNACVPNCIGGVEDTAFPPGLEPLEPNRAPSPSDPNDPFPERIEFVTGDNRGLYWAHARGFIKAPLTAARDAFCEPEVVVDRRTVGEWSVVFDVESGFDCSFRTHNVVHELLTIEFDVTWRQRAVEGTREAPSTVAIRFQKTSGTSFIEVLAGSVVLVAAGDGVTEIQLIQHLSAAGGDEETLRIYLDDLYRSVVARAHGQPLPSYE